MQISLILNCPSKLLEFQIRVVYTLGFYFSLRGSPVNFEPAESSLGRICILDCMDAKFLQVQIFTMSGFKSFGFNVS